LLKNSLKISVLNLFHFNAENIFYTILYKLLNPAGKVYLKLDIDIPFYEKSAHFFNAGRNNFFKIFLFTKLIQPLFFNLVHTISAESKTGIDYFSGRFKPPFKKMLLLPNGVDEDQIGHNIAAVKKYNEKENIIISVGRIGTRQKNNEMLLNALKVIELNDWTVHFIGTIEETFNPVIESFFNENPGKRGQVFFTGHTSSPVELYEYYNRAKIFCLTSEDEGFPLSACEAAYFGNYLVLTDHIYCFDELTDGGKNGTKIQLNNITELSDCLTQLITNPTALEATYEKATVYAKANLTWQAIIPKLYDRLFPAS
jgi:glycosyltransferase involved in cell wall biosynthesis